MKMHKELNELIMVSEVFPKALLAVLAAEPDVSVGDCAVASVLPRITAHTNNINRLYKYDNFKKMNGVRTQILCTKSHIKNLNMCYGSRKNISRLKAVQSMK
jgi:hypothetical protein